jgi:hypothetical protein
LKKQLKNNTQIANKIRKERGKCISSTSQQHLKDVLKFDEEIKKRESKEPRICVYECSLIKIGHT